jgi:polyphosphate glucokinase
VFPTEPRVLAVDIGGTNVKFLATGQNEPRRFPSGKTMTPASMVDGIKARVADWPYDVVAIGFPAAVADGCVVSEPKNLGSGWIGFDFDRAFGCPARVINDAAMQALGSYRGGRMLFLGLGTGLGATLIVNGMIVPLEVAHLSYRKGTYEDYLGVRGLKRMGKKKWARHVAYGVERLTTALQLDDVVIGGGNVKKLDALPAATRAGDNALAFAGGFRLWSDGNIQKTETHTYRTASSGESH